jgi:hypothetical protein
MPVRAELEPLLGAVARLLPGGATAAGLVELALRSPVDQGGVKLEEFLRGLDRLVGSSLFTDAGMVVALRCCINSSREIHRELSVRLATFARRFLNVVTQVPALSSECARLFWILERASVLNGAWDNAVSNELAVLEQHLADRVAIVAKSDRLSPLVLAPLIEDGGSDSLLMVVDRLLSFGETLGAVAVQTEKLLQPMLSHVVHRPSSFHGMEHFESKGAFFAMVKDLVETLDRGDLFPEARRHFVAGHYLRVFETLGIAFDGVKSMLEGLRQLETGIVFEPLALRHLEGENYLYSMSLAARLVQLGEALDDAEKIARSAFEYATKNRVACLEVLDEEILKSAPVVRKDALARARLEVKLNAPDFPLSVAAKDRVLQRIAGR